jgi:hypothetical protein
MSFPLTPVPRLQFLDSNGNPIAAGKLYSYTAGTSTPQVTYADSSGTPNANPVVLDSAGRTTVYLDPAKTYKFILNTSADVLVWSQDNVAAPLGADTATTLSNKTLDDSNIITVQDTQFTVESASDTTAQFRFDASQISSGLKRVVTIPNQDVTLAGQNLQNVFTKRQEWGQGANVASAGDLTLGTDGNLWRITGTTAINAITTANWSKGAVIVLLFESGLTLHHNAVGGAGTTPLALKGAVDYVAQAGDVLTLVMESNSGSIYWREVARTETVPRIIETSLTLTDAQIKALDTTPIQIIPAPGSGKFIQVLGWAALIDLTGGIYTNVDAAAALFLDNSALTASFAAHSKDGLFNGSAAQRMAHMAGGTTSSTSETSVPYSALDNQAVYVATANNAMGDFTGGNAANSLTVYVTYQVKTA